MSSFIKVMYRIPVPFGTDHEIVVYGEPDMGWYEWRIEVAGKVIKDTKNQGYGCAEIALRDALIDASN